ncbi:uncharacterized protein LOC142765020 [Rhipicephalus microplus]|uniref:uncharacterized protein LOC142765020 n=1 Tax=Rhipicephalus microplus TaxID=6941 RepID=UPI003F6D0DC8
MGESSMYEASSAVSSTESSYGTNAPAEEERRSKLPLIILVALLLLLLLGVVFFMMSKESSSDATEVTAKSDDDGHYHGGGCTVKTPSTPAATTKKPKVTVIVLTCTYGMTGVLETQLPPDGVCDLIFYTHVYFDTKEKKFDPLYGQTAYKVFTAAAAKYKHTTFGLSMALGTLPTVVKDHKSDVMAAMNDAMKKDNIVHFGMLEVDVRDYAKVSSSGLQFLPVIGEVLKGKPKQMCFLGIFNATDGKSLVSTAKQAVTDFPAITMIILQVHHAKAAAPTSTFPIAPNPDTANLKDHGVITLNDIKDHIGDLKDIPKKGTYLLISIAMFGRAYLLKYNNKLDLSNSSMVVDYGVVCVCKDTCKRSKDPSDPSGSTTFDVRNNTAVDFYDGPDSIHEKTTARLNILPHNYTGIAAYSVEMDDFYQICDDKKFKRLISIKTKITELTKSGIE